jgi:hypothetical protein
MLIRFRTLLIVLAMLAAPLAALVVPVYGQDGEMRQDFNSPLRNDWQIGDNAVVGNGELHLASQGHASYTGQEWSNLDLTLRLRRTTEGHFVIHYRTGGEGPHYILLLGDDFVTIQRGNHGQFDDLGPSDKIYIPTYSWMELNLISAEGEQIVSLDGREVLRVFDQDSDDVDEGGLHFHALTGANIAIDWVEVKLPVQSSNGLWGNVPKADLAVTDIFPENMPRGKVFFHITNNGPDTLNNTPVNVSCYKWEHVFPTNWQGGRVIEETKAFQLIIHPMPGETHTFYTQFDIDTDLAEYEFTCHVNFLNDPKSGNNEYTEAVP